MPFETVFIQWKKRSHFNWSKVKCAQNWKKHVLDIVLFLEVRYFASRNFSEIHWNDAFSPQFSRNRGICPLFWFFFVYDHKNWAAIHKWREERRKKFFNENNRKIQGIKTEPTTEWNVTRWKIETIHTDTKDINS